MIKLQTLLTSGALIARSNPIEIEVLYSSEGCVVVMRKISEEIVMRNNVSRFLPGWWVEMRFVHCLGNEIGVPADKELISIKVPATHHRCPWDATGGRKYDTIDQAIERR